MVAARYISAMRNPSMRRTKTKVARTVGLGCLIWLAYLLFLATHSITSQAPEDYEEEPIVFSPEADTAQRPHRIAIADHSGQHEGVVAALIYTSEQLRDARQAEFDVYTNAATFQRKIIETIEPFYSGLPQDVNLLLGDLQQELRASELIDVLVLASCAETIQERGPAYFNVWKARTNKFKLVCVVEDAQALSKVEAYLRPWRTGKALSILTLSDHVTKAAKSVLPGYSQPQTFTPLFPYNLMEEPIDRLQHPNERTRLASVSLVGSAGYSGVWADLTAAIDSSPKDWGYLPRKDGQASFQVDAEVEDPVTVIYYGEDMPVPALLKEVAQRKPLNHAKTYKKLHGTDLLVAPYSDPNLIQTRTASAVSAALIGHVPILASQAYLSAYPVLDERTAILLPEDMPILEAILALRVNGTTKATSDTLSADSNTQIYTWPKSESGFTEAREAIYKSNQAILSKIATEHVPRPDIVAGNKEDRRRIDLA